MTKHSFVFTPNQPISFPPTAQLVAPSTRYDSSFGFITSSHFATTTQLKIPELNSGFSPWHWLENLSLTTLTQDKDGIYATKTATTDLPAEWMIPLLFKMAVPHHGNYEVTVTLYNPNAHTTTATLFGNRRKLLAHVTLAPFANHVCTLSLHTCPIIPRSKTQPYADKTLDITVLSASPIALTRIDWEATPDIATIYIAGDSTVTDQDTCFPYHPSCAYAGWGQMLPFCLKAGISVSNHAHSGLTSESFRTEGHYAIVLQRLRPNDYVLLQFGHNDQKLPHLDAFGGYTKQLTTYIQEIKQKGAQPILVTPLARNTWLGNGNYNDLLADYAHACRLISQQEGVALIDLHQQSKDFICAHGLEKAKSYFFPDDYTHTNDYGALLMATYIATACQQQLPALSAYFKTTQSVADFLTTTPLTIYPIPTPPATWQVAHPEQTIAITYTDLTDSPFKEAVSSLIAQGIILQESPTFEGAQNITRITILSWIVRALRFVPTNVYNDHFVDVYGHEWYAGTVEIVYQNALVDPALLANHQFSPLAFVREEELVSFLINALACRKQLTPAVEPSFCQATPYARSAIRTAHTLGLLDDTFQVDRMVTKERAAHYLAKLLTLL